MLKLMLIAALFTGPSVDVTLPSLGEPEACAQVVVYATDPLTGFCFELPTPCGVPPGWDVSVLGCAS